MIQTTIEEAFKDYIFYDEDHSYLDLKTGKKLTSVTTLIGQHAKDFDTLYWSSYKSQQLMIPQEEIIKDWEFEKYRGVTKGSLHHDFMESRTHRKIFKQNIPEDLEEHIAEGLETLKEYGENFIRDNKHLITISTELVVGDRELGICGMLDKLYYNKERNILEIWDWKTDKKLEFSSKYNEKFLSPLEHLDDCNYNKYSLQLSLYKYIFEKNTGLKTGNMYIVWFNEENENYKILKLKDLSNDVLRLF